jgi:electron transfer flavoprotein alpha subunit
VILVATWDEHRLRAATCEALGAAATLASALGGEHALVSLGRDGFDVAGEAGRYGAVRAILVERAIDGDTALAALVQIARDLDARVVLLSADDRTAEIAPRLAERLGGTAITQTVALEIVDGRALWTRATYGGKALATVAAAVEPVVATLRRGAFPVPEPSGAVAAVSTRPAPATSKRVELLSVEAPSSEASLEDAKVILSGGAGLGAAEAFTALEELAERLGGAVGASLAAVDAGWAPTECKVGLTGKTVSPDVYFALGISGASQHLTGIGGATAVVAVNIDPDAPIFNRARLGVVMDCKAFIAAMLERLRSAQ